MNAAHLHLAINHLPLALPIAALIILLIALIYRSGLVMRSAYALLVVSAISAFITMASGDKAEDMVEDKAGISEEHIEEHEEAAESFAFLSYGVGLVAIIGLWASWREKSFARWIAWATIAMILVQLLLGMRAGESGGEINHPEIHSSEQA